MEYTPPDNGEQDVIGGEMSDDDQQILRLWRESLSLLDTRYEDKRLLRIAARAMVDDEFRAKLVEREWADAEEPSAAGQTEPGPVEVRFHVNTAETLHVVVPPRAGEAETRPAPLRDELRSRTSARDSGFLRDDFNLSDPGGADPPITLPHGDGVDSVGAPLGGDTPLPPS